MEKRTYLEWYDIVILSLIFFGEATYHSILGYFALSNQMTTAEEAITFTSSQNWAALWMQFGWLCVAIIYLYFRKFDFNVFLEKIKWNKWVPLQAILIFVIIGLANDIYSLITYYGSYYLNPIPRPSVFAIFGQLDISLLIYSLFNGFYEEIFFLGICFAVTKKHFPFIFAYSLLVRFIFHTYQGMSVAIGLGFVLGTVLLLLYRKVKPENLTPFFLAHAIADIIGLSVIYNIWR